MVQVHSRLCGSIAPELTLLDLFKYPTVSAVAAFLKKGKDQKPALERVRRRAEKQKQAIKRQKKTRAQREASHD
jgi:hypothetical protein